MVKPLRRLLVVGYASNAPNAPPLYKEEENRQAGRALPRWEQQPEQQQQPKEQPKQPKEQQELGCSRRGLSTPHPGAYIQQCQRPWRSAAARNEQGKFWPMQSSSSS